MIISCKGKGKDRESCFIVTFFTHSWYIIITLTYNPYDDDIFGLQSQILVPDSSPRFLSQR
jgi:hypothetical protein